MRRQPADLQLVGDVGGAEHAGGEADEGGEHDEHDVEVVDEQVAPRLRPVGRKQQQAKPGASAAPPATLSRAAEPVAGQQRQQRPPQPRGSPGWR